MLDKLKSAWKAFKFLAPLAGALGVAVRFLPFGGAVSKALEAVVGFAAPLLGLVGKFLAWVIEKLVEALKISVRNPGAFACAYAVVFAAGLYFAGVWRLHDIIPASVYQSALDENDGLFKENATLREKLGKPARTKGLSAKRYQARTAPTPGDLARRAMGGN